MEIGRGKVMVTGGTGFIGGHLVLKLLSGSWQVIVPYIQIDKNSIFATEKLASRVFLAKADLTNFGKIDRLIKKSNPDYIIHLAAQPLVTRAYKFPRQTLEVNIMGTVNLLESARKNNVKSLIIASSDKAYGYSSRGYKETDPLTGKHPYDVSKSSADLVAQAYFKTYELPVVITRFGNVYGIGDLHFDRLLPGLIKAVVFNRTFKVRSNGKAVRDYIHVDDVVSGYCLLLDKIDQLAGQVFNFSSSDNLSVIDVIKLVENRLGIKIKYEILNQAKGEIQNQHLDDSKTRVLGWKQAYNLGDSIGDILPWYRSLLKSQNV